MERPLSLSLYIGALLLTIIVFGAGVWIGNFLAGQVNQDFYNELDSLQTNTVNLEFLSLLESDESVRATPALQESMCLAVEQSAHDLGVQTADVGRRLRLFEQRRGQSQDVLSLEQRYFALEARDYLFWKKLKNLCSTNLTLVIYFYRSECGDCAPFDQAIADFKQVNPPGILVYSFNLDHADISPPVALLASMYKIQSAPAVVVNDEKLEAQPSPEELQRLI